MSRLVEVEFTPQEAEVLRHWLTESTESSTLVRDIIDALDAGLAEYKRRGP